MKTSRTIACPRCGSASIPIVYGFPSAGLFEAADRGEVSLGGCMVEDGQPTRRCVGVDCGIEFEPIPYPK